MVRGKGQKKELLSLSALDNLKDEKKELEATERELNEGAGAGTRGSAVDKVAIRREINRLDTVIGDSSPGKIGALTKDALLKEEEELEEKIALGMPTQYEMRQPTKNPGAVRKHIEWGKRNAANIERYVHIQRLLRPFEPKSIEVLRKEK